MNRFPVLQAVYLDYHELSERSQDARYRIVPLGPAHLALTLEQFQRVRSQLITALTLPASAFP